MKSFDLGGRDWSLIYVKNEKYVADGMTGDVAELRRRGYDEVPAVVPGNLELDLIPAGKMSDPYYGDNFYDRRCEYLHAFYTKEFEYTDDFADPVLYFEGIDTAAEIYLNGKSVGRTENMLISHEICVAGVLKKGRNVLTVHITPAVIKAREYPLTLNDSAQKYNRESLYIRKAPHMYGWDIMPRIVSAGIWRPVRIEERKPDRITEFFCYTVKLDTEKKTARLYAMYNTSLASDDISRYSVSITGECKDSHFEVFTPLFHNGGHMLFNIENAKFWWSRNMGDADLYSVTVTLSKDGKTVDTYKTKAGVRTVVLDRTSCAGNGGFCFILNGKKVFCMGTNWVPADAFHSRDAERIPKILPLLTDIGCNTIRIWGGGVYEDDLLYDYCDENGIMIWQDFIMGCATYPQDGDFLSRMRTEVESTVKRLRRHPSIILWAGDNENDCTYLGWYGTKRDPNTNRITREVIPQILAMHDFTRPYLPSSPYYDEEAYRTKSKPPEDHLWGPRNYFKGDYYKNSPAHFASEIGYHGCPSPASLAKFIPPEYLWTAKDSDTWSGIEDNKMWIAHATAMENDPHAPYFYRIRLMANQVTTLFGKTVPCTLSDFAKASQISQAEALKFFIEHFRINKWNKTGIIWWNLIDGWPQISDAVVDWYFIKKLAYHYIRRSQNRFCLMFGEENGDSLTLYAVNDTPADSAISYKVTDLTTGKLLCRGTVNATADSSVSVEKLSVEPGIKHFFLIEWTYDGKKYSNHYMTNIIDIDYKEYLSYISSCGYDEFEGF